MSKKLEIKRNSSIELLRIINMIMVVGTHFAGFGDFSFASNSITQKLWCSFLLMGGSLGVDIFVIISGYFLVEKTELKINWKKIIKLFGQIFFYSIALLCLAVILKINIDIKYIIEAIIPIERSQWWFASTYFVLYLIHPYLNKFLQSLNKKQYQVYIIFILIIWSIIPNITISTNLSYLSEFIMYYSIAGYVRFYGLFNNSSKKKLIITFSIITLFKYILFVAPSTLGFSDSVIAYMFDYVYKRNCILTIIQAIYLFKIFLNLNIKYNLIINRISSTTFGIYLIHDSKLSREVLWNNLLKISRFQNNTLFIPYSLIVILFVFISCSIIDMVRQITFENILLKYIDKISKYIDKIYLKIVDVITNLVFNENKLQ